MGLIKSTLTLVTLLAVLPLRAEWVEAQGEALIVDGDVSRARAEAIEQALNYASLRSGVSFESEQQVVDGRLVGNSISLQQQLMTGPMELISEQISNSRLRIRLKVELVEQADGQCPSQHLKAAILLPEAAVSHRSQLAQGQLFQLGEAITQRFSHQLDSSSATAFANLKAGARLALEPKQLAAPDFRLPGYLAAQSDSQYVLVSSITNVETEPEQHSLFGLIQHDPKRQFVLSLNLFHGISGEMIWRQEFATSAPWEFGRTEVVPANSDRFWRSAYGQAIDKSLKQAVQALDQALFCRPVLGQIVAKQGQTLILNLGRRHGLQVGDELSVILAKQLSDRMNASRTTANSTKTDIKITQITEGSARAELTGLGSVDNIQISDLVLKNDAANN